MHAENRGDLIQPAAAHPVGAVLVLLHLLEAHPELIAELGLRHLSRQPVDANIAADDFVDLLRPLLQHGFPPAPGRVAPAPRPAKLYSTGISAVPLLRYPAFA